MLTFAEWARADNETRFIRCRFQDNTLAWHYFSNGPVAGYIDRIKGNATSSFSVSQNRFLGLSDASWGSLKLINIGGDLDYLTDLNTAGRQIIVEIGDPDGSVAWEEIIDAVVNVILAPALDEIEIRINSLSYYFDSFFQKGFFISGFQNGNMAPVCMGDVFNPTPIQVEVPSVDFPGGGFYVSANTGTLYNVFDDGVKLTEDTSFPAVLPLAPGKWRREPFDYPTGFWLGSVPAGVLTCDFSSNDYDEAELAIQDIVESVIPSGSITIVSPSGLSSPTADHINLFVDKPQKANELVDKIAASVGGFVTFNRDGNLVFGVVQVPNQASIPILQLTPDDIFNTNDAFILERQIQPFKEVSINFFKNWKVIDTKAGFSAGFEDRTGRLGQENILLRQSAATQTTHKLAKDAEVIDSLIHGHNRGYDNNAATLWGDEAADILYDIQQRERYTTSVWRVKTRIIGMAAGPGDLIKVTYPRFGFHDGRNVVVLSVEISAGDENYCVLRIWDKSNMDSSFSSECTFGPLGGTLGKYAQSEITTPPLPAVGTGRTSTDPDAPPPTGDWYWDSTTGQWYGLNDGNAAPPVGGPWEWDGSKWIESVPTTYWNGEEYLPLPEDIALCTCITGYVYNPSTNACEMDLTPKLGQHWNGEEWVDDGADPTSVASGYYWNGYLGVPNGYTMYAAAGCIQNGNHCYKLEYFDNGYFQGHLRGPCTAYADYFGGLTCIDGPTAQPLWHTDPGYQYYDSNAYPIPIGPANGYRFNGETWIPDSGGIFW